MVEQLLLKNELCAKNAIWHATIKERRRTSEGMTLGKKCSGSDEVNIIGMSFCLYRSSPKGHYAIAVATRQSLKPISAGVLDA